MANHHSSLLTTGTGPAGAHESLLVRFFDKLLAGMERARERRFLDGLSEAQLKDVGMTRGDVEIETSKPFWRA